MINKLKETLSLYLNKKIDYSLGGYSHQSAGYAPNEIPSTVSHARVKIDFIIGGKPDNKLAFFSHRE
jgi:hypothetical protein